MKSKFFFSSLVFSLGLFAAACSSAPVVEDVGVQSEQSLLTHFTSAAEHEASVIEQIASLREQGWVIPAWSEARLENVREFHRLALRITHKSGPLADLVFSDESAAMTVGEDSIAKPALALRPVDDAARAVLETPVVPDVNDAPPVDGTSSVESVGPNPGSCSLHLGYCGGSQVCCNLRGLSCRNNQCVKPVTCNYVEALTTSIVCFNDGDFVGAAYWHRFRRGWDFNYAAYATYRGCQVNCPGLQTLTTRTLVCGRTNGTCNGI